MLPNQRRPIGAVLSAASHNGHTSVASPLSAASTQVVSHCGLDREFDGRPAVLPWQIRNSRRKFLILATIHENVARQDLGSARPVASILPRSSVPGPVVTKRLTFKPQFRNSTAMAPVT